MTDSPPTSSHSSRPPLPPIPPPPSPSPLPPPARSLRASIPNLLTMLRLVMTVGFVLMLSFWSGQRLLESSTPNTTLLLAAGLFILAALTDALDGHLARRWNVVSRFGRIMDPFADKVLVLGAFIVLASPAFASPLLPDRQMSGVDAWMVVLILGRELLITSIRAVFEGEGIDFSAGISGKIKMIVQAIAVPLILIVLSEGVPSPGSRRQWIIDITVWSTILITVVSGIPYITRAIALELGEREP